MIKVKIIKFRKILLLVCFGIAGAQPEASKPGMVQIHGGTLFWSVIAFLLLLMDMLKHIIT